MNTVEIPGLTTGKVIANTGTWRDSLGIVASIACAIHCAAMPFVIAYLPALGLSFLADEGFHKWMALACFLIAIAAFLPGFRKHKNLGPISMGAVGLVLITFAAFGLEGECCPSCEDAAAVAASGDDQACDQCDDCQTMAAATDVDLACDHCEDCQTDLTLVDVAPDCEQCDDCDTIAVASDSGSIEGQPAVVHEKSWLSTVAPWVTPFGAILLVTAHLYNRRYGCLCACC